MHWPTSLEDIGIVNFIAAIAVLANIAMLFVERLRATDSMLADMAA